MKLTGWLKIDSKKWKMDWFTTVTEEQAIKAMSQYPSSKIKKVWKVANGLTVPNYLKKEIEKKK